MQACKTRTILRYSADELTSLPGTKNYKGIQSIREMESTHRTNVQEHEMGPKYNVKLYMYMHVTETTHDCKYEHKLHKKKYNIVHFSQ